MPGPMSDSYDPEFGTGENAQAVSDALTEVREQVTRILCDPQLKDIVEVALGDPQQGPYFSTSFSERELRLLRFALNRALETI